MGKTFDNEWLLDDLRDYISFKTKRMFGGLAVYIFEKQVIVIVEPTKSGRWDWHGVLVCTDHKHQASLIKNLPGLAPHEVLKKWLYLDTEDENFESTMEKLVQFILLNDERIGIFPKLKHSKTGDS